MTKLIFEKTVEDSTGINLTDEQVNFDFLDKKYLSSDDETILPNVSELECAITKSFPIKTFV